MSIAHAITTVDRNDPNWLRQAGIETSHYWPEGLTVALCGKAAKTRPRASHLGRSFCPACAEARAAQTASANAPEVLPRSSAALPLDHVFTRPPLMQTAQPDIALRRVLLDEIVPGRYQPRTVFEPTSIDELAASLAEHGLLTPIKVFWNEHRQYELIAGERRVRAARQLGWTTIAAEVVQWTLRQIQEVALIDNLQRADLSPIEEGRAFERLIAELGLSENELSKRLGKNRAYLQQRRAVARAAPEVQQALDGGTISFTQARAIAQAAPGDPVSQAKAVKEAIANPGLSEAGAKRTTEQWVRKRLAADLQKLGWSIDSGGVIWSPSDRPRAWSGTEMLEAVRTQRRPAGDPVASGTLSDEEQAILELRYWLYDREYQPWIKLGARGTSVLDGRYVSIDEVPALVSEITTQLAELQARYAAQGWTLARDGSRLIASTTDGARNVFYRLDEQVTTFLDQIVAGTVSATPAPSTAYVPRPEPCEVCKKKVTSRVYFEGKARCPACLALAKQAQAERRAGIRARIRMTHGAALHALSADTLRLLLTTQALHRLPDRVDLATADHAGLMSILLDMLTLNVESYHTQLPALAALMPEQEQEKERTA